MASSDASGTGVSLPGQWKTIAVAAWKDADKDNVALVAAGVAFYAFLAFVPLLAAVVLIYGLAADPATVARHIARIAEVLPASAADLISGQIEAVVQSNKGAKGLGLMIALGVALFGARNGAGGIVKALNIVYEESECRGFVKQNGLALLITLAAALAAIGAVFALTSMSALGDLVPGMTGTALFFTNLVTYLLMFALGTFGAALLFRYAPDRASPRWSHVLPGALFASFGWLLLTLGFGIYVSNFGSYNATYGSLGAVIVLLTWLYLSAYVLLLGAELDEAVERHAAGAI